MIDIKPSDHALKEIRFENGMGNAVFENGFVYTLNVKFDELSGAYTFNYQMARELDDRKFNGKRPSQDMNHQFMVISDLSCRIPKTIDITSWVDFGQLAQSDLKV